MKKNISTCVTCGLRPNLPKSSYCKECKTKRCTEYRKSRVSKGLCGNCGRPSLSYFCAECKEKTKRRDAERRKRCIDSNICVTKDCGRPIKSNIRCEVCLEKHNNCVKRRRKQLNNQGLCEYCGKLEANKNRLCEVCCLKKLAERHLGDRKKWILLKEKIESQKYICPYTGIRLFIGDNSSVDHIIPKSSGGIDDIENIQWVHIWINLMKFDLSHDEFVVKFKEFIELVKTKG